MHKFLRSAVTGSATVGLVLSGVAAVAAPTLSAADSGTGAPVVAVTGTLYHLADVRLERNRTLLRVNADTYVPVSSPALSHAPSGSLVRASILVPGAVRDRAASSSEQTTITGASVQPGPADLRDASDGTPATQESPLGAATIAEAYRTGDALTAASVNVAAASSAPYAPAVHQLTVAIAKPAGSTLPVPTQAAVQAQVAGASSYWSDNSAGGVTLSAAKIMTIGLSVSGCSEPWAVWSEAQKSTGFQSGPNKHLVVVLPKGTPNCAYGLGTVGTSVNSGGVVYVNDTAWPVLAHELGHNLGLNHADYLSCPAGDMQIPASVPAGGNIGGGCSIEAYGDPYDVMAASAQNGAGSLSAPQALTAGLMPAAAAVDIANTSRTVTLAPMSGYAGLRAVRVLDPRSGETYYVEYRTRTGRDSSLYRNMTPGVRVLRVKDVEGGSQETLALDATPSAAGLTSNDLDRAVQVGRPFVSYSGGVQVEVRSAGAAGASVTITSTSGSAAKRPIAAVPVAFADRCAVASDGYTIPTSSTVDYRRNGLVVPAGFHKATGAITITATPRAGYAIVGSTSWQATLGGVGCATAVTGTTSLTTGGGATSVVTWRGIAPAQAGQLRYDVVLRSVSVDSRGRLTPGAAKTWLSGTTVTAGRVDGRAGISFQVQVRTRDGFGYIGPYSDWRTITFPTDDRATGAYRGTWKRVTLPGAFRGGVSSTSTGKSSWTVRAWTSGFSLVGVKQRTGGRAAIYLDGRLKATVDTYASSTKTRQVLATVRARWGQHTLTVVNLATKGRPALTVDAVTLPLS